METVNATCSIRTSLDSFEAYMSCALKSFLCGLCVYLAVKSFNLNRLKPLGIGLLVFFVFLFVYCGFQHCIANMFYFGMDFSWKIEYLWNILIVVLTNSIGALLVRCIVHLTAILKTNKD